MSRAFARRRSVRISAVVLGLAAVPILGASASADSAGALTPFVDCSTTDASTGEVTAYFGYSNTTGSSDTFAIGDGNEVIPGDEFQGQPTTFNAGTYPRVFRVQYDPQIITTISWILNGVAAEASNLTPACVNGLTTPAESIGTDVATLTGVVVPDGVDTSYSFEYGATSSLGSSTATGDAGTGSQATSVQAALTGLTPGTTYYYRLDSSNSFATTQGAVESFTTAALAPPPAPTGLAVATSSLPSAKTRTAYSATLQATGGSGKQSWSLLCGSLPAGLHLNSATGAITGTPRSTGRSSFTVEVRDVSLPGQPGATLELSIQVVRGN